MFSIVVPVYNEEKSIEKFINELILALKKENLYEKAELIIVDDGSSDNTNKILKKYNIKIITNTSNKGYGYSLKKGIGSAKYETILIMDADLTYPLSYVKSLIEQKKKGYDLVIGARSGKYYNKSIFKSLLRRMLICFAEFITSKKIRDINSGFRIFDKSTTKQYFPRLCNTFSFTTTQTVNYLFNSLNVSYINIEYNKRIGKSKVKLIRDSFITFKYLLRNFIFYRPFKFICSLVIMILVLIIISLVIVCI